LPLAIGKWSIQVFINAPLAEASTIATTESIMPIMMFYFPVIIGKSMKEFINEK
jgi:hypothetical protein